MRVRNAGWGLSQEEKAQVNQQRQHTIKQKEEEVASEMIEHRERVALRRSRVQAELQADAAQAARASECRFSPDDVANPEEIWSSEQMSASAVSALRAKALDSPAPLCPVARARLQSVPMDDGPPRDGLATLGLQCV